MIEEALTQPKYKIYTAKDGAYEKIFGLEYGADDYFTKSFSIMDYRFE